MTSSIQVLHVDDDLAFLELVATYLERESEQIFVQFATDVETAYEILEDSEEDIECIISDYEMPSTSGLEFLEGVRERNPAIPFILYTGKGSEEIASEAISAGVTDYVHKDVGTEQYTLLANKVENVVSQYRAEQKVRENERRFRGLIENSSDIISILDERGVIQYQSPSAERILGYQEGEVVGEPAFEFVHPEDRNAVMDQFFEAVEHGEQVPTVEYRFRHRDGSWVQLESTGMNRFDDPAIEGFVVNSRDITEREALKMELRERERKIRALHEIATQLESCRSCQEVYDLTVGAAERILDFEMCVIGIEEDGDLVVQAASDDLPEEARTRSVDDGIAGKTYQTGESYLIRDGTEHDEIDDTPYQSGISIPIGNRGNFQAVATEPNAFGESDLELAELLVSHTNAAVQNIERAEKLQQKNKRLEEFSSVISHDLRSPLNIVEGMIALTKETGDLAHLSKAENAINRMDELIADLLSLAKDGKVIDEEAEVVVAEIADQAWKTSETPDASVSVEDELGVISADPSRLQTLLENLFRNAVEHGGSDVTVRMGKLSNGFFIADDGPGVPADQRDDFFDDESLNLHDREGFGLVIVQQIVEAHGWSIRVTESKSGGARFEITGVSFLD